MKIQAYGYYFTGNQSIVGNPLAGASPTPQLEKRDFTIESIAPDQAVVKIAGCGLCHTDIGFIQGGVKTKLPPPIILGHEISGTVIEAGSLFKSWIGKNVIVPAVLPCGECELCRNERDNICQHQKMPGNDFHGGFASHLSIPGRFLCELPVDLKGHRLSQLSVIADAVTTPYQSLLRSRLKKGDVAVVIGTGGIGIYMVQHAKNAGAHVIALDIDEKKLEAAKKQGAELTLNTLGLSEKEVKSSIRNFVEQNKLSKFQWKLFETSGSSNGQNLAFSLLSFAGTLGIVGFTMEKLPLRLSNLMAFDADLFGNWGCRPIHYNAVVKDVLDQKINILENIQEFPLTSINEVIALSMNHKLDKRVILIPN